MATWGLNKKVDNLGFAYNIWTVKFDMLIEILFFLTVQLTMS